MKKQTILALLTLSTLFPLSAQQHSDLWGVQGEKWDPETGRLRDFTNVGYRQGNDPIPDWPVGATVTDFGAVPDDKKDDSQAFLEAIAACPPKHAVLVPGGRYILLEQLRIEKDFVVLRGEDVHESILFFPKNLIEIYPVGAGFDRNHASAFLHFAGTTHQSVENLSLVFREQQKMGHWEFRGADAIRYDKRVEDSWARNLYIKNADHGIQVMGKNISVLNVLFDHSIIRPDIIGSSGVTRWVGHVGIGMTSRYSLYHNIEFTGKYFHDFDIINVPAHNVVSNVKGYDMALHHHGQGANHNLYTHVDVGVGTRGLGGLKDSQRQRNETHWRIFGDQPLPSDTVPLDSQNGHVFVGYDADIDTTITDTLWFESIDPKRLHPQNIYLAQMEKAGKPLPRGSVPSPPPPAKSSVVRIEAADGNKPYFKFDLRDLDLETVHRARLRVHAAAAVRTPFSYLAFPVEDDAWTRESLESGPKPAEGAKLDEVAIREDGKEIPLEFDVTAFVKAQLAGDRIVSLKVAPSQTGTFNGFLGGIDRGNAPMLILETLPDPVSGPPSAPTGLRTAGRPGHIRLDWADNPEADVATYNVYRSEGNPFGAHLSKPIATGLILSEFEDVAYKENRSNSDLPHDATFHYVVTAVDRHFNESEKSAETTGKALDPTRPMLP